MKKGQKYSNILSYQTKNREILYAPSNVDYTNKSRCQSFIAISHSFDPKTLKSVYTYASKRQTSDVKCPYCGKVNVYVHSKHSSEIKDFPLYPKHRQSLIFQYHGYKCRECG